MARDGRGRLRAYPVPEYGQVPSTSDSCTMCPPESCCCCKLPLGVQIGAGLLIAWSVLALALTLGFSDESVDAFCAFEHLEGSAECGEACAVHESGAWFTSSPDFYAFTEVTFPGYSGRPVPVVPLCSSGQGAQKTYTVLAVDGVTADEAQALCTTNDSSMTLASIASADENERARQACGDHSCWLGLESASATKWKKPDEWIDGTSFDYANWWPVNQPPAQADYAPVYVFMNIPGAEPGEHCTGLTIGLYVGVLTLLFSLGMSVLALVGANSLNGERLDIVWQAFIGLYVAGFIMGGINTSQTVDINPFIPPGLLWGPWLISQLCISLPLNLWWVISVRSLAGQCKDGSIGSEDSGSAAAVAMPVATAVATPVVVANPATEGNGAD